MDILVELDKKFHEIVTDKLDVRGKEAVPRQLDPASMTASEVVKIRKDILHLVYGKCWFFLYLIVCVCVTGVDLCVSPLNLVR